MGILKKLKPKLKNIDISSLTPKQVIYFCKTQVIDKKIMLLKGEEFNQDLADAMEKPYPFYFIVKSNLEYDVLSGLLFQPFMEKYSLESPSESEQSKKCVNHYIKMLK